MREHLLGTGQSLSDARRRSSPSEVRTGFRAGRGNAWSYYVFRHGLGMLQRRGIGQRISINGIPEAVVLEP